VTDDEQRQIASEIEQNRPSWLVMWGCYSRLFWAFPRFSVPRGTIVGASSRDQLLVDMDSVEAEQSAAPRKPAYAAPTASALPRRSSRLRVRVDSPTGASPGALRAPRAMPPPASRSYEPYVPDRDGRDAGPHGSEPYEADPPDLDPYDYAEDPYGVYPYEDDPYASSEG
jgi:hypothetical protein